MTLDAADDRPRPQPVHQLGQDLSALSLDELDERMVVLRQEIERLEEARRRKQASMAAASAFFKS